VLISIVRRDASFLENHRHTTGGTTVAPCDGSFYETCCNGELGDDRPNRQMGD
jgi:hypothetical protein